MSVSYFLSDIHIKSNQDLSYQKLNQFLETQWPISPGNIYLLGDIFDLWVSDHQIFIKTYSQLIQNLKKIKNQGFKIVYFEGNHDLHLEKFWQEQMGFEVQRDVAYYQIDRFTVRLEHGDLINQKDEAYLKLRRFLRNPYLTFLAHNIPGFVWNQIGRKWSQHSRKTSQGYRVRNNDEIISMLRTHAQNEVQTKYFDAVISGHMHVKDEFDFVFENKIVLSINLGSWFEDMWILKLQTKEKQSIKDSISWIKL